jgi:hypothetical protein
MLLGVLGGAILAGFVLAVSMANSGGAWDNAKKWVEAGHLKNAANETCGKAFRWQDEDRPGRQRSRQNTIYCSLRCARNQARREYQRRQQSAKTEQRSVTP